MADFSLVDMSQGADAPEDRARLHVTFYREAHEDPSASEAQGMPVFKDWIMLRKLVPGDPTSIPISRAYVPENFPTILKRDPRADHNKYPEAWRAFLDGDKEVHSGIPLKEFPALVDSQRKLLAFLEVHTVEELAALSESAGQHLQGFQALKRKAQDFLAARKDASAVLKVSQEAITAKLERDEMKSQLEAMAAQLAELQKQKASDSAEVSTKQKKG
jgi:hypothetical protein